MAMRMQYYVLLLVLFFLSRSREFGTVRDLKELVALTVDGLVALGGQEYGSNSYNSSVHLPNVLSAAHEIQFLEAELRNSSLRYFVYKDPALENMDQKQSILNGGGKRLMLQRYGGDIKAEIQTLEALKKPSKYQVQDPHQADLYIIPLSLGATLATRGGSYDKALGALYNKTLFQATQGHRHVLLSLLVALHKYSDFGKLRSLGLTQHYQKLWNVTVVNDNSWAGVQELVGSGMAAGHDFENDLLKQKYHASRHSFSIGLTVAEGGGSIPLIPATRATHDNSSYFIFYHSRPTESMFNSTQYRWAPMVHNQSIQQALPESSIGYDLPAQEWMQHFTSSKFCLVIRGDTVHSHALLRAVRVGCIPVVVADMYPWYAPTFESTIRMSSYAVFLEEEAFMKDPMRELSKLNNFTEQELNDKLQWLAFAQKIFFSDHPDSLYVPAFMREAHKASRRDLGGTEFPY